MPSHFVCSTLWFFAGFAMRLFFHALFSGVFFEPFSHPFLDYFWIPLLSPPSLHSPLQHTASHLKRRLEKMRDHDVMIGGGSDEKRLKVGKKETKNPNPAFGKRSKNFN